jgi:hypothetical protein
MASAREFISLFTLLLSFRAMQAACKIALHSFTLIDGSSWLGEVGEVYLLRLMMRQNVNIFILLEQS